MPQESILDRFGCFDSSVRKWVDNILSVLNRSQTQDDGSVVPPSPYETGDLIHCWQNLPYIRCQVWPEVLQQQQSLGGARNEHHIEAQTSFVDAWEYVLDLWGRASRIIAADAERHGADSSKILASGALMLEFCQDGLVFEAQYDPWPDCLGSVPINWPAEKMQIIQAGETELQRLVFKLEADQMNGIGWRGATKVQSPTTDSPTTTPKSKTTWKAPEGYIPLTDITHDERFKWNGKNPHPQTVHGWIRRANASPDANDHVKVEREHATAMTYVPEAWAVVRWERWKKDPKAHKASA